MPRLEQVVVHVDQVDRVDRGLGVGVRAPEHAARAGWVLGSSPHGAPGNGGPRYDLPGRAWHGWTCLAVARGARGDRARRGVVGPGWRGVEQRRGWPGVSLTWLYWLRKCSPILV